jgi:hypothetical protein
MEVTRRARPLSRSSMNDVLWREMWRFRGGSLSIMVSRAVNLAALLCLCTAVRSFAQDPAPAGYTADTPTKSFLLARTGESLNGPYIGTIHYLEFFQVRKKWVYPDIGYLDFAHNYYREFFIGGGRTLYDGKIASWDQELLYDQALGPAARSARYLQPYTIFRVYFTPKFRNETDCFLYLPLNDSARIHFVLERAKFEYSLTKKWKIGAGYAGNKFPGVSWVNKPFLSTTISTPAGAFEFWLQKIPGGAQVQFRYALVHTSR